MFSIINDQQLPTILLIDDDLVSREVMATVLTLKGYTVYTAPGGQQALDSLSRAECDPDLILMDAQMPDLSGVELIAALRPQTTATILVISASNPPQEIAAAADGFLLKPFTPEELQKFLNDRQAPAQPAAVSALDPADPVVNPDTLAQLRNMMPEAGVRQIYAAVFQDLARRLTDLEAAMARGDTAEIRRIGHAIKGGCGMAGALGAARIGALIESGMLESKTAAGGDHLDNAAPLLRDLRAAALSLERMLDAEFPV